MQTIRGDQVIMGVYALILQKITCLSAAAGAHKRVNPCLARASKSSQWQQSQQEKREKSCVRLGQTKLGHRTAESRAHRDTLPALPHSSEETFPNLTL